MSSGAMGMNFLGNALTGGMDLFGDAFGVGMRIAGAGAYAGGAGEVRERGTAARDEGVGHLQTADETARRERSFARGDYITEATTNELRPGESFANAVGMREDVLTRLRTDRQYVRNLGGTAIREARQSGKDIVASVTDSLGQRVGALSRSLKNEQDQAFVDIDSQEAAGTLTPAAAAEMKQRVRLEGARRVGDQGAAIASDFAELKTQRRSESANLVAGLQGKFAELETGFDLGGAEIGVALNAQVLSAMDSDRDFARSLYNVVVDEIEASRTSTVATAMAVYGMTMDQISIAEHQNLTFASMLAGIPPAEWAFDPGAAWSNAAAIMQQNEMSSDAQSGGGMF